MASPNPEEDSTAASRADLRKLLILPGVVMMARVYGANGVWAHRQTSLAIIMHCSIGDKPISTIRNSNMISLSCQA